MFEWIFRKVFHPLSVPRWIWSFSFDSKWHVKLSYPILSQTPLPSDQEWFYDILWISKLILMAWLWVSSWRCKFKWVCIRIMILTYWSYYLIFFNHNLFLAHLQFVLFIERRDLIKWMNAEFSFRWTLRKYFSILNFGWWIFVWSMLNSWYYNHKLYSSSLIPFLLMTKGEKSDDLYYFDSMTYMNFKSMCDMNVIYALQNALQNPWEYRKIDWSYWKLALHLYHEIHVENLYLLS